MAVRTIQKSWWVDLTFNHTRIRKRSPENSKAGAQAYEALLRHKLARGENIDGNMEHCREIATFRAFAQEWFDDYVMPNNKYSERKAKQYILCASLIPFFGNLSVEQITTEHVERYKAAQLRAGIHPKTVNNRLTVLNKLLRTAYEWKRRETVPPKAKKLSCPPAKTDYLSPEECELLLSRASGLLYEMLLATLRTGMRQGELKGLQWEAIDWDNRTLTVRHSWNDELKALEAPKNNRERIIPLSADVYAMLFGRKRDAGFVFLDANGTPFTEKRLNPLLAALCARAGLRRITWHILRHTFATHLATRGTPLNAVQILLGHSAITTTMRYAHVPPSALREAIDGLESKGMTARDFGQPVGNQGLQALAA